MTNPYFRTRFNQIKEILSEREKKLEPIRQRLQAKANEAEQLRVEAMAIRKELDDARGPDFFALKKEFGWLAKQLGGF